MADDSKGVGSKFVSRANLIPGATAVVGTGALISGFRGKKVSDPESGEVHREGISKAKVFFGGAMTLAGFLMLARNSGKSLPGLDNLMNKLPGQNR